MASAKRRSGRRSSELPEACRPVAAPASDDESKSSCGDSVSPSPSSSRPASGSPRGCYTATRVRCLEIAATAQGRPPSARSNAPRIRLVVRGGPRRLAARIEACEKGSGSMALRAARSRARARPRRAHPIVGDEASGCGWRGRRCLPGDVPGGASHGRQRASRAPSRSVASRATGAGIAPRHEIERAAADSRRCFVGARVATSSAAAWLSSERRARGPTGRALPLRRRAPRARRRAGGRSPPPGATRYVARRRDRRPRASGGPPRGCAAAATRRSPRSADGGRRPGSAAPRPASPPLRRRARGPCAARRRDG